MVTKLGKSIFRETTLEDAPSVCELIYKHITDTGEVRRVEKLLKHYITTSSSYVVEEDGVIVGVYAGNSPSIHYFICNGNHISFVLISYMVLCVLHDCTKPSYFKAFNNNSKELTSLGSKNHKNILRFTKGTLKGEIPVSTKVYTKSVFNRFNTSR